MTRRGERPILTPAQQYLFLKSSRVGHGTGSLDVSGLIWEYKERPTPLSREYTIRIEYKGRRAPDVFVIEPNSSALAGDREMPHVYKNPLRLCLYLPGSGEWDGQMRIDRTFVPWTLVWLYYFEEWLASNDWKGGGVHVDEHHSASQNRRERRRTRRFG